MAKQTIEQTIGLCREAMSNVHNAYDRGYKQGFKDGQTDAVATSYEKGLNDAWETAKEIVLASSTDEKMNKIFADDFYYMNLSTFFKKYSVDEVMAKIKEYEEKQEEQVKEEEEEKFKVGDEVTSDMRRFIVLGTDTGGWCHLWCLDNGLTYDKICSIYLKKTGKSFPQLVELFKQMKGE